MNTVVNLRGTATFLCQALTKVLRIEFFVLSTYPFSTGTLAIDAHWKTAPFQRKHVEPLKTI